MLAIPKQAHFLGSAARGICPLAGVPVTMCIFRLVFFVQSGLRLRGMPFGTVHHSYLSILLSLRRSMWHKMIAVEKDLVL